MDPTKTSYTKICSLREVTLTQKAASAGVAPPVCSVAEVAGKRGPRYALTTKVLGPTLMGLFPPFRGATTEKRVDEYCAYAPGIYDAYDRLHAIGILHNDPSEENLVIEDVPSTLLSGEVVPYKVWIIDYGMGAELDGKTPEELRLEAMAEEVIDRFGDEYAPTSPSDVYLMEKSLLCFIRAPTYPTMIGR